eukprot:90139-Rhodomonas_salina.1
MTTAPGATPPMDLSKLDMNEAALPGSMAITAAQVCCLRLCSQRCRSDAALTRMLRSWTGTRPPSNCRETTKARCSPGDSQAGRRTKRQLPS